MTCRIRLGLFLFLSLAATAGCGETAPEEAPRAAAISISPSSSILTALGETVEFTARVDDQYGEAFVGTVGWTSSDAAVITVSAGGVASAVANGAATLTASIGTVSATVPVEVAQAAAALVVVSGGGQEGVAGNPLPEIVQVRVDDPGGSPAADVAVDFTAVSGHGTAEPSTVITGGDGLVATTWTLGEVVGIQTLTARAGVASIDVRAAVGEVPPPADSAIYGVSFVATWSSRTHPNGFPSGAHFSPLIGATHNGGVRFWANGDTATDGIEDMAETGATGQLASEIRARIPGDALAVVTGPGIGSPGTGTISNLVVTKDHPLVTLVTMIAPSPDWFVGVSGLSLRDEFAQWREELEVILYPYDAGTDDGTVYTSANANTSPRAPIRNLRGTAPFSDAPIGTFTFKRQGAGRE